MAHLAELLNIVLAAAQSLVKVVTSTPTAAEFEMNMANGTLNVGYDLMKPKLA
jgi:hypothetical protein